MINPMGAYTYSSERSLPAVYDNDDYQMRKDFKEFGGKVGPKQFPLKLGDS
jgi:hypothetical protein